MKSRRPDSLLTHATSTVAVFAGAVLALAVVPAYAAPHETETRAMSAAQVADVSPGRRIDAIEAGDLLGLEVRDAENGRLATVQDVVIDLKNGRILHVVLDRGEDLTVVPPRALRYDRTGRILHWDLKPTQLMGAPKFGQRKEVVLPTVEQTTEIYSYYGAEPYFVTTTSTIETGTASNSVHDHDKPAQRGDVAVTRVRMGEIALASKLIDLPVKNARDEKIGEIDDLVLDLSASRVVAILIKSGGVLGMGRELRAVPPVIVTASKDRVLLDVSEETLNAAPRYKASEAPDYREPENTARVYRAYNVEPYFDAKADNTSINARDRDNATVLPTDQGNNKADLEISASIRRQVVKHEGLSITAMNVKIITRDGQVMLRGPVNTTEEKRIIGEIATGVSGAANVRNDLDVKAP